MALVDMRDMIYHAYENNYAVGAFDLVSLDFLEAVIGAAERCRAPVILSVAEPHFAHYDFELMLPAIEAAAVRASIPVAIQLDHGSCMDLSIKAINLGCNGVMCDASHLPLPDNIDATKSVVKMAHACGIPVTGELGHVAGSETNVTNQQPEESILTTPAEAGAYVERTGVDFLAVSIGTVQGRVKTRAKLDFPRLKLINQAANIPLEIHGGTGLSKDQFYRLTSLGVAKINYYTGLSDIAAQTMREKMKADSEGSFTDLKQGVKAAIDAEVERCLKHWGSAGRAAEVLTQCKPWAPVEQQLIFNVEQLSRHDVTAIMQNGKQDLLKIPGVRDIFVGEALKQSESYQFCWRIRFVNKRAIDNFRTHPDGLAFTEKLFRPYVSESISLDFQDCSDKNIWSPSKPLAEKKSSSPISNTKQLHA